jgi:hypothetical protein
MVFNRALKEDEVKLLCRTMGVKCRDRPCVINVGTFKCLPWFLGNHRGLPLQWDCLMLCIGSKR